MLISDIVKVKWNSKTKRHYVEHGYTYTKMVDMFDCNVNDLTNGSNIKVKVKCDYCSCEYEIQWYIRYKQTINGVVHKDACQKCAELKSQEALKMKYGTSILSDIDGVNDKRIKTNIEKYGCENPFGNKEVQRKIKLTNIDKYGVENPAQNDEIQEKIKNTNLNKYKCECVFQSEEIKEKSKATCMEKYGYENYMQYAKEYSLFTGENSPHWSGGDGQSHQWNFEYIDWRNGVLEKDNFQCQCCGVNQQLEAHHIQNWSNNIDLRFVIDNGIILCHKCHMLFHSLYSRKNNNKEQLDEFIFNHGKKIC